MKDRHTLTFLSIFAIVFAILLKTSRAFTRDVNVLEKWVMENMKYIEVSIKSMCDFKLKKQDCWCDVQNY